METENFDFEEMVYGSQFLIKNPITKKFLVVTPIMFVHITEQGPEILNLRGLNSAGWVTVTKEGFEKFKEIYKPKKITSGHKRSMNKDLLNNILKYTRAWELYKSLAGPNEIINFLHEWAQEMENIKLSGDNLEPKDELMYLNTIDAIREVANIITDNKNNFW